MKMVHHSLSKSVSSGFKLVSILFWILFWILGSVSLPVAARATSRTGSVAEYASCFASTKSAVENELEREFLSLYVKYLQKSTQQNGQAVLDALMKLKQPEGEKYSSSTVGIFEGSMKLSCNAPSVSMGSATLAKLWPKVKSGDEMATEIVLLYSTLIQTDGTESSSLRDYQKQIRKHDKRVKAFIKKYDSLLQTHSINWLI